MPGRPALQVVREGNPGHKTKRDLEQLQLPPGAPPEPKWIELFPPARAKPKAGDDERALARHLTGENKRARERATREWRTVVSVLDAQGLLARVDEAVLTDHCVVVASITLAQRDIALRGVWVPSERGTAKNPSVTALSQLRAQLRFTTRELALSPKARAEFGMAGDPGDADRDADSPYDV